MGEAVPLEPTPYTYTVYITLEINALTPDEAMMFAHAQLDGLHSVIEVSLDPPHGKVEPQPQT